MLGTAQTNRVTEDLPPTTFCYPLPISRTQTRDRPKVISGRNKIPHLQKHWKGIPILGMADKKSAVASQAQKTPEEIAREHDLLPKLIPHFDRHLIFPLLEFVASQETEPVEEITKTKYELLKHTNMTDYVANLWREIHGVEQIPEEFLKKREEVLNRLQLFVEEASKITELLENDSVVTSLRSDKLANLQFLREQHGVCPYLAPANDGEA